METQYSARPVLTEPISKRIEVIDVLRGFALLGIIVNHIDMGFLAGMPPPGMEQYNIHSPLDQYFSQANFILTFGKFFTIFSFLFGLSFSIQMASAQKKGSSFTGRFIWRLVILFMIGFIHNMFFSGDILVIYAVLGLLLILARNWRDKTLLIVGCILVLNIPLFAVRVLQLNAPPPTAEEIAGQEAMMAQMGEMATVQYQIKKTGSFLELLKINTVSGLVSKFAFQIITGRLWITYGLFLLGMYAGRKRIFEDTVQNRLWFRRLALGAGIIAAISTTLAILYGQIFGQMGSFLDLVGSTALDLHQASLSAFYVSIVVLVYWNSKSKRLLSNLAPLGKMGLSTYLFQSFFGLTVFYGIGFGMLGELGSATSVVMGLMFFVVQILYSRIWSNHFTMGPIEWIWRSATYFNLRPFKKDSKDITISA